MLIPRITKCSAQNVLVSSRVTAWGRAHPVLNRKPAVHNDEHCLFHGSSHTALTYYVERLPHGRHYSIPPYTLDASAEYTSTADLATLPDGENKALVEP